MKSQGIDCSLVSSSCISINAVSTLLLFFLIQRKNDLSPFVLDLLISTHENKYDSFLCDGTDPGFVDHPFFLHSIESLLQVIFYIKEAKPTNNKKATKDKRKSWENFHSLVSDCQNTKQIHYLTNYYYEHINTHFTIIKFFH